MSHPGLNRVKPGGTESTTLIGDSVELAYWLHMKLCRPKLALMWSVVLEVAQHDSPSSHTHTLH